MNTLFPIEPAFPPGFSCFEDFLSLQEESELLKLVAEQELKPMQFQGYEAKRKVASFGHDWSFEKRLLSKGKDIPPAFSSIVEKVASKLKISSKEIAEMLLTEYPVGSVINWHRDAPPFDLIAGVSLKADCVFRFRPYDKARQGRGSIITFPVRRRSLYLMKGESRSEWEHSIAPVKNTRYSITLRTLKVSKQESI